ncbi:MULTISPECIES: tRNA preQ1(34) S-adenosylmethionine ribosyltransferase-isomerase QueA [unclassified Undibacterium]|uniref:tRNA preQ1(34) S-adenosylmethionine ribosyltransferase-isomerase QueA n=1 Tax=unclassified Undibacterium TaxID=2630295 RepID=UPI002AC9C14A|nr:MULTISPECIES: tRNA preQ1(34) S-adenosylmethionine ribosyltransferase-isomerase QueA [unclassified Undibacterium]MEB0137964.1 tRNA preQ1(34) S-adenosylmethionine ribosyltransferase-isomerase QueA [Undibacterium sp. CCC2.1]MEB0173114.1 tRNA preQ1(34) S-adenosylmethionine ribosyltransferase-isomerase QueA [Undibacterium sp. CCC1.1]MEB0174972.1 tRNA preQ1(34) S-adenosylmethionine ribosyltransferase-isomerase QueA [Undibacterium sp. CCC3.4]MEB0216120.1 tRNA preQ1(34) S-adenosylmethionine ribosylt
MNYSLTDFDFDLPPELIAQFPLAQRTDSRLLDACGAAPVDRHFGAVLDLLAPGDLLVFNDTRVLKARFFGVKESGGKVQLLIERVLSNHVGEHSVLVQMRASKAPLPGSKIRLADSFDVTVGERVGEFFTLFFPDDIFTLLETYGRLPLPPYIAHDADDFDEQRYQTVYNRVPGAVAAPTAGLHFDEALLKACQDKGIQLAYVTLHVGAGTFQPVRVDDLAQHQMHSEWYSISSETVAAVQATKAAGGRVVAVGTTSMRALESASQSGTLQAGSDDTRLFITPGYVFKTVDRLITNFHLPKSTLMMLVSAFAGYAAVRAAYAHAITQGYRFFSYGDAMLLDNHSAAPSLVAQSDNRTEES